MIFFWNVTPRFKNSIGDQKTFFLDYLLNQFLPFSEKQEFLPDLGNFIIDHWINPKIYINKENNPKNFAMGWVKLAPNKKLNKLLTIL